MNSQLTTLFKTQDNAEKIRDQIAAILKLEFENQKALANNDPHIENKNDFDISVYLENTRPWELTGNSAGKSPFPLVNVCLNEITEEHNSGGTSGLIKYKGSYCIDCYACGNFIENENEDDVTLDDSLSTFRAWQTARITRNILMSGFYTYLGMQSIVRRRRISKITTIIPNGLSEAALAVTACRIFFEVDFQEDSLQAKGVDFEEISFIATSADGEVNLAFAKADTRKEE